MSRGLTKLDFEVNKIHFSCDYSYSKLITEESYPADSQKEAYGSLNRYLAEIEILF